MQIAVADAAPSVGKATVIPADCFFLVAKRNKTRSADPVLSLSIFLSEPLALSYVSLLQQYCVPVRMAELPGPTGRGPQRLVEYSSCIFLIRNRLGCH